MNVDEKKKVATMPKSSDSLVIKCLNQKVGNKARTPPNAQLFLTIGRNFRTNQWCASMVEIWMKRGGRQEAKPPFFNDIVRTPCQFDGKDAETIDETKESMVTFVLNGRYEWLESDLLNLMRYNFNNDTLQIVSYPPLNDEKTRYKGERAHERFLKNGW